MIATDKNAILRRVRSEAISASLGEIKALSADIRASARAFGENLDRVARSEAIASMRALLSSIR